MGDEAVEFFHLPIENIESFTFELERDFRRRSFGARMLVFSRVNGPERWEFFTPVAMEVRKCNQGLSLTSDLSLIRLDETHAKHIGEELVRANVVIESKEEKDRRIEDLKLHIKSLEKRIQFFETMMLQTTGMEPEQIRMLREE